MTWREGTWRCVSVEASDIDSGIIRADHWLGVTKVPVYFMTPPRMQVLFSDDAPLCSPPRSRLAATPDTGQETSLVVSVSDGSQTPAER
ncbi:hypothetical protein E2C01_087560 [Portunus trituberculatus]|uniref:Uncharacterized protein n=1 Tax=Portunus trituberculatus TaxID=210409 RepID=A0A5B7JC26_PORTR|nr:hypothetical protein [Portunus trituberculatus]